MVHTLAFYVELSSLIIALIAIIYIFGIIKLVDHSFGRTWKLFLLGYILFIITKLFRVLDIEDIIDARGFHTIGGLLFILILSATVIKLNKIIKVACDRKTDSKRKK